ncbi:MAG: hypothetical protein ACYTDY_12290 [Planctomycetota bacterium]|jgi:tetratricopeptide (TPR) repeat protein
MNRWIALTCAFFGVLLLASSSEAELVYLRGGTVIRGEVVEMRKDTLVMSLEGLEDSRVEIPFSRISDFSLYELKRARIDQASSGDHERLGDWAMQRRLFTFAMEEYSAAVRRAGDEASEQLEKKRDSAATRCAIDKLERGRALVEKGRLKEAREFFLDIVKNHPFCPVAKTADKLVARIEEQIAAEQRKSEAEADLRDVTDGLRLVQHLIKEGDRLRRLGYLDSGNLGKAEDDFLAAIEEFRRALRLLDRVADLPGTREKFVREKILQVLDGVNRRLVDTYVDVGHNYILKGNLIVASRYMGLALTIDPYSPKALGLRQSISAASAK